LSGLSDISGYEDIDIDPVKAYAYFLVSSGVNNAVYGKSDPLYAQQQEVELAVYEQLITSKLTAQEHLDAENFAIELLKKNQSCCSFDPRLAYKIRTK